MKVLFDMNSVPDAETAVSQCLMLAQMLRQHNGWTPPEESETPPTDEVAVAATADVEEKAPVAKRRGRKPATPVPAVAVPVPAVEQQNALVPGAREELLALARTRGILWTREVLANHGAAKLSELSDAAVAMILAA